MKAVRGLIVFIFGFLCVFCLNGQAHAYFDENNQYDGDGFLKSIEELPYDARYSLARALESDESEANSLIKRFYKFSMPFLKYKTTKLSNMSYGMAIDSIINELKIDSTSSRTMAYKEAVIKKYMLDMAKKANNDIDLPIGVDILNYIKSIFFKERNATNDNEYKRAAMFVVEFSADRVLY